MTSDEGIKDQLAYRPVTSAEQVYDKVAETIHLRRVHMSTGEDAE